MQKIGEPVEDVEIHRDEASHDIVLGIRTDLGLVGKELTPEEALHLGIALIRESGKRYVFKEKTDAKNKTNTQPDTAADSPDSPVPDAPGSGGPTNGARLGSHSGNGPTRIGTRGSGNDGITDRGGPDTTGSGSSTGAAGGSGSPGGGQSGDRGVPSVQSGTDAGGDSGIDHTAAIPLAEVPGTPPDGQSERLVDGVHDSGTGVFSDDSRSPGSS